MDIIAYYSRPEVAGEIAEFLRGRWAAIEGSAGGKRIFIRYRKGRPLTITSPAEVSAVIRSYSGIGARTFYGTLAVYRRIESVEDVEDPANITAATPFWDIDVEGGAWEHVVEAAEAIVEYLELEGVTDSVYILWSGEGAHVRINEGAFSEEILSQHHPIEVADAVVDHVLKAIRPRLESIVKASGGALKVESLVDPKRVFTAPLSLHRRLDRAAVCFKPKDLPSFELAWVNPTRPRHDPTAWRRYSRGEADDLARKALSLGKEPRLPRVGVLKRKTPARATADAAGPKLGRFPVMALLQAARYYLITGDLERAKSFGLNRAIFYAWAKHYGRYYAAKRLPRRWVGTGAVVGEGERKLVKALGDEEAYVSSRGYFVMGDREQTPEDYDRYVAQKIDAVVPYEVAWEAALKYVSKFPKHVLLDQQKFYKLVYEPVRDRFIEEVVTEKAIEEAEEKKPMAGKGGRTDTTPKKEERRVEGSARKKRLTLLDFLKKGDGEERG